MFRVKKTWDNRNDRRKNGRLVMTGGRSWTRRISWLEDEDGISVKLKLQDGEQQYREVLVNPGLAQTIWGRFKSGQTIDDAVSFLGTPVPAGLQSKRAKGHENRHPSAE